MDFQMLVRSVDLGDPDRPDAGGQTALHHAARAEAEGHDVAAFVVALLGAGADPHRPDHRGETPFNIAAPASPVAGRLMTAHWFAQAVAGRGPKGLNDPSGSHGSTLAQYIAKWSNDAEIRDQIAKGVAKGMVIDRPNASGWTPLTAAAAMGRLAAVRALAAHYSPAAKAVRTTEEYVADYRGQRVVYAAGLTAAGIARARLEQDRTLTPGLRSDFEQCIAALG